MKNFINLVAASTLLFYSSLNAQWVRTSYGVAAEVNCIVAKEGNLFAGTSDGVFRSTDGGSSWTAVNNGLSIVYASMVYSLAVVSSSGGGGGTNLFAGVEDGGIWRSTDDGDNWTWV